MYYETIYMKYKGQQPMVSTLELLAFAVPADVGKWSNPVPLQGAALQLRGFASHRRLQLKALVEAATLTRAKTTTAEAAMTCNFIIGIPSVDLKEIHSDVQQLPDKTLGCDCSTAQDITEDSL